MKIWHGYGSEHSMNLVMIGHFKEEKNAIKAAEIIDDLRGLAQSELDRGAIALGRSRRFSDAAREKLLALNIMDLSPAELEQFVYDVSVGRPDGPELRLTTDEADVSGFLKIMIHNGAKVEVFSAHDHPEKPSGA